MCWHGEEGGIPAVASVLKADVGVGTESVENGAEAALVGDGGQLMCNREAVLTSGVRVGMIG